MTLELIKSWFERLPQMQRDMPLILIGGRVYTPRQVLAQVERGTGLGLTMQTEVERLRSGSTLTSQDVNAFMTVGQQRALTKLEHLPPDFSLMAIGKYELGKGTVDKDQMVEMVKRREGLGKTAVEHEAEKAIENVKR